MNVEGSVQNNQGYQFISNPIKAREQILAFFEEPRNRERGFSLLERLRY